MLSKNELKRIRSLKQKKYRKQHNAFVVEGEKSVKELAGCPLNILQVVHTPRMAKAVPGLDGFPVDEVDEATMKSLSSFSTAAGILAVVTIPEYAFDPERLGETLLALDGITDPGNLGTIIRTADWFGITDILCSENTVDLYNPKTIQATMGSFSRVKIHYVPLAETIIKLKGHYQVLGLAMDGEPLHAVKSNIRKILITGSESNGMSPEIGTLTDKYISIPAYQGKAYNRPESLNASIATAIACYELAKK